MCVWIVYTHSISMPNKFHLRFEFSERTPNPQFRLKLVRMLALRLHGAHYTCIVPVRYIYAHRTAKDQNNVILIIEIRFKHLSMVGVCEFHIIASGRGANECIEYNRFWLKTIHLVDLACA